MGKEIKLIAFDLDGTLLTTSKEITSYTRKILEETAARGIEIVPATGRIFFLMKNQKKYWLSYRNMIQCGKCSTMGRDILRRRSFPEWSGIYTRKL